MAQFLVLKQFFKFEIIYIYRESKNSTENSHFHHFSDAEILCNHGTFVKTKNSALVIHCLGFSGGSDCKESACNPGELGSIPESGIPPEKGMATHSSILAWEIPWTEEPGGYSPWGHKKLDVIEWLTLAFSLHCLLKSRPFRCHPCPH